MGTSSSRVESETIANYTNEIVNRSLTINENVLKNLGITTQNAKINVLRSIVECTSGGLGIDQRASADIKVLRNVTNTDVQAAKTEIENQLSATNEQSNEMVQEFLGGIGMVNDQETVSRVKMEFKNTILNEMTTQNINHSINSVDINQNGEIIIIDSTYKGPCSISQDALIQMQLNELVQNITEKVQESSTLTEADLETRQTASLEQKGFSLFGSLGMFLIIAVVMFLGIPLLPLIIGGGRGFLIGLLIAVVVFLAYIGIFYATQDRLPWEPTCVEKCKDVCKEDDEDCVPCIECEEHCKDCEECEPDSTDCYTCEECFPPEQLRPPVMRVNYSTYI